MTISDHLGEVIIRPKFGPMPPPATSPVMATKRQCFTTKSDMGECPSLCVRSIRIIRSITPSDFCPR